MIYLVRYDPPTQTVLLRKRFEDSALAEAEAERLALEHEVFGAGSHHEVLLLEAATEETLRRNHARYFDPEGLGMLADALLADPGIFSRKPGEPASRVAEISSGSDPER